MLNYFQILADSKVTEDGCGGLKPIVSIIKQVVSILHIIIPIALIAYGTFDLGKAVMASDDKQVKEAQGRLIKRCIYAIIIFLVPYLVSLIMSLVDVAADNGATGTDISNENTTSYSDCWKNANK